MDNRKFNELSPREKIQEILLMVLALIAVALFVFVIIYTTFPLFFMLIDKIVLADNYLNQWWIDFLENILN